MTTETITTSSWRDYYELCKPKVVMLLLLTAVVGVVLASPPGRISLFVLLVSTLGIGLAASAGAVINQVVERENDAKMARTEGRPMPQGKVSQQNAFIFAVLLAAASVFILTAWINVLTAVLTFASMIGYAVIYTMYLKKATPQNIVIGGASGAMPPVLGWAAVTGEVHTEAMLLFLIIFAWTPPHFWALALYRTADYAKAGLPMLPVTHGKEYTRLQVLLYTIILFGVSLLPYAIRMSGLLYLAAACVLGAVFLGYAIRVYVAYSDRVARAMFRFSILYLAALFGALLLDHYLAH